MTIFQVIVRYGCFQKLGVPPNHPSNNRGFHYFHHPFWGTPIFGNTHITPVKTPFAFPSLPGLVALVPESPHTSFFCGFFVVLESSWKKVTESLGKFFGDLVFEGFNSKNEWGCSCFCRFFFSKENQLWFSTTQKKQRIALIGKKNNQQQNTCDIGSQDSVSSVWIYLADLEKDIQQRGRLDVSNDILVTRDRDLLPQNAL